MKDRRVYLLVDIPLIDHGTLVTTLPKGKTVFTLGHVADKWIAEGKAEEFKSRRQRKQEALEAQQAQENEAFPQATPVDISTQRESSIQVNREFLDLDKVEKYSRRK